MIRSLILAVCLFSSLRAIASGNGDEIHDGSEVLYGEELVQSLSRRNGHSIMGWRESHGNSKYKTPGLMQKGDRSIHQEVDVYDPATESFIKDFMSNISLEQAFDQNLCVISALASEKLVQFRDKALERGFSEKQVSEFLREKVDAEIWNACTQVTSEI